MPTDAHRYRQALSHAKRIVVKVGTRVLVDKNGRPNKRRIANITEQLAYFHHQGKEIVLVTSGAVGAGLQVLGMKKRPTALPELQMAAAVGQTKLMEIYGHYFSNASCIISQVLLTHADLKHRGRHLNARNTMLKLLSHKIIPIVNENDVVSVDEIRVGDNDILSSLVATLIDADLLILLTTPNGLLETQANQKTKRVPYISSVNAKTFELVGKKTETLSTGGMSTKLKAAQTAAKVGAFVVIASGAKSNTLLNVMEGKDVGTLIGNRVSQDKLVKRKRWISYFHKPEGELMIDDGAVNALRAKGKSLLPVGIKAVEGQFAAGSMVIIVDESHQCIGYGLVEYSSQAIQKILGKPSQAIESLIGYRVTDVVVHRDNMALENEY